MDNEIFDNTRAIFFSSCTLNFAIFMDEYIGKLYSFATIIESFDFIFNWNEFHFFLCRFDRSINADVSLSNRRRTQLAFFINL